MTSARLSTASDPRSVIVQLDSGTLELLRASARVERITLAAVIRQALAEYLARQSDLDNPGASRHH